jgi:hypothetical protein
LGCATVELSVPVATPLAFVGPLGCVSVFPEPVADNDTVTPGIALPLASRAVTVIVLTPPSALMVVGLALTDDCDALTAPAVTFTVAVCVIVTPPAAAVITLACACVELNAVVATPPASVVGLAGLNVFAAPVALNVTGAPGTGLPN